MIGSFLLLHGWGCGPELWNPLLGHLGAGRAVRWDRGYFGGAATPAAEAPFIAIGHSLGALLLAHLLPPERSLVAINGFDRFAGPEAVPPRVVDRMRKRFAESPASVLAEFHARCGTPAPSGNPNEKALAEDLLLLADFSPSLPDRRMLVLHGARDPILPSSLRDSAFPGAMRETHPEAGHALPFTHPEWCAERIRAFACG